MKFRILSLAAAMAAAAPAFAQRVDIQQIPDLPIKAVPPVNGPAPPEPEWKISIGGGISDAPRYEGSAYNRVRFMPLLEATYEHLFISLLRGAGYNFSDNRNLEYGLRVAPGHARRENADPLLNGAGNISYGIEPGAFFNARFAPWYLSSGISAGVHGSHAELGGGIGLPLSPSDRVRVGVNLNWGNTKYNQTYFGITGAQAAASGGVLTPYAAGAGVKDYAITANWAHNLDKQWFTSAGVSYKWLVGSARNSPLTVRDNARSINFVLGYRY